MSAQLDTLKAIFDKLNDINTRLCSIEDYINAMDSGDNSGNNSKNDPITSIVENIIISDLGVIAPSGKIINNWTIQSGFKFANPDNDSKITDANNYANTLLTAALTTAKNYTNDISENSNIIQSAVQNADLVPVGKTLISLIPLIISLIKGIKLPTSIILDIIAQIIKDILIEQIKSKLPKEAACIPLHIGERYEALPISNQLILEFQTVNRNGNDKNSRWHVSIPEPKAYDQYDWCKNFQDLKRTTGNIAGRISWEKHSMLTTAYFSTEKEAELFMEKLSKLSALKAVQNDDGKIVRITKNSSPKRKPKSREIQCNRAIWIKMGDNGEPEETHIFIPPPNGC